MIAVNLRDDDAACVVQSILYNISGSFNSFSNFGNSRYKLSTGFADQFVLFFSNSEKIQVFCNICTNDS